MRRFTAALMASLAGLGLTAPTAYALSPLEEAPRDNLGYLFAAFVVVWLALFAYLLLLSRRQRDLEREVRALRRALEARQGEGPPGESPPRDLASP